MKPFRFRLESVLTLRNWEEERARTAYGQALEVERRVAGALEEIENRFQADLAAFRSAAEKPISAAARAHHWRHLFSIEQERHQANQRLVGARRIREQKMKLLIDAHRRVMVLRSLRERQAQAHRTEMLRQEEREIGDLIGARYGYNTSIR